MKPDTFKILGIISFLVGCVFILNSFSGITGFVVAESIGRGVSSVLGLVFVLVGVLLFLRGRDSLRRHNKEARYAMGKMYMEEYGKSPTRGELRKFIREHHEKGSLHDLVGEYS